MQVSMRLHAKMQFKMDCVLACKRMQLNLPKPPTDPDGGVQVLTGSAIPRSPKDVPVLRAPDLSWDVPGDSQES